MSVLLIDDEVGIRSRVRSQLQDQGIQVTVAATLAEAEPALALVTFGVVILELTLPDGSGLDLLDRLHAAGSASHVIMLGESTDGAERVRALERGADDFVVKPFYVRELTARVLAVRRRRDPVADTVLHIGRLDIHLGSRVVTSAGETFDLTAKEFDLLAYLAARPGHVFDREQLLNAVWRSASAWQQPATVTEHIRRLRQKLEVDPAHPELLTTVRGAGYRLDLPTTETEAIAHLAQAIAAEEPGELVHVNGLIVFCDQAAADLVGASAPDAVVGTQVADLVGPTALAAGRARFAETGDGPARRSELMELRQGNAGEATAAVESTPTDWQGQPARRLRLTPVTDAGARLRGLLIGVLGDLADAIIISDLHFHIHSWNAAAERLYGWREAEVRGRHVLDVLHGVGDREELPDMWEGLERTGRWHGESTQRARDGSEVEVLSSTTLVRDEVGEPVGIVSVNRTAIDARRARSLDQDKDLATRLQQALAVDEFVVHYQPVVDLAENRLITLEALVRWNHPERGTLLPGAFLDTAENSGLIIELGEVVLDKACRQAADWRRSGADIRLSVNVSTRQLADPGMVERFTDIVRDSGLDPACLWLEVTETAVVEELEKARDALRRLVDLGVGVAIDDFGTGWASLTYLRNFPVHALKIDASFVARAGHTANDTAIVRSILSLGAELDLFVVAEGIETQAQHEELAKLGCSLGQGYLFGHPTAAGEVPVERAARITAEAREPGDAPGPAATELGRHGLAMADTSPSVGADPSDAGRTLSVQGISERKCRKGQTVRAERMESIGTHATGVAHDLNNILAPIMMATNVLQAEDPGNLQRQMLDTIATSTAHASDVVGQILLFAQGVDSQRVEVAVDDVLDDVERLCNRTFLEAIVIERSSGDGPLVALVDPTQLHQVLLNLCVNARDAMPDGGTIELSARLAEIDLLDVGADEAAPGCYVRIRVRDDGSGIPPEVLDRLFEPFFTTKEQGKGTGLGLATSTRIVHSHGGFIRAASTEGVGTTIDVHLPAVIA